MSSPDRGGLRDLETISVALTAAETGHLVFRDPAPRMHRKPSTA
jgi:Tfp pilus assembly pilus retraction ATPase PilT